jgi:hypothetical protein
VCRLTGAQLQGASLDGAKLQGASLEGAQLQGASLEGAQLQGASFFAAQLQGANLFGGIGFGGFYFPGASLEATDLSKANLWRTDRAEPRSVKAIKMPAGQFEPDEMWLPSSQHGNVGYMGWRDEDYQALRTTVESIPPGSPRDWALQRIQILDCANKSKTLASCDYSAAPPPEGVPWRKALESARVSDADYAVALSRTLRDLVCFNGDDAIYVVRGSGFQVRLKDAGRAASGLIDDLANKNSKDCPIGASLTDDDRAKLLRINRAIEAAKEN